jgi:hypothetical protein
MLAHVPSATRIGVRLSAAPGDVDPDVVVEIFVFDPTGRDDDRTATAEGQRRDDRTGEATDEEALDAASSAGG